MIQNRVDFQFYNSEAEFPDYGNWFTQSLDNNIPTYVGGTVDELGKLPYGGLIPAGATAICQDTGATYVYSGKTATAADWVQLVS